ncbi:UrcA family protein [Sphingomonas ginkgonis]|nr:UrcA family protein [Sphingomonas ginkgonis]
MAAIRQENAMAPSSMLPAAALFLVAAVPALARPVVVTAPEPDRLTVHIPLASLDLATSRGERALARRVTGAVRDLCNEAVGAAGISLVDTVRWQDCSRAAWSQSRPQMEEALARARAVAASAAPALAVTAITISLPTR